MLKEYLFILGMFFDLSYFHILRKQQSQHGIKCGLWIVDCVFDDFSYDFHLLEVCKKNIFNFEVGWLGGC